MKKSSDIPSHYYEEVAANVQLVDGISQLSLDPQMPFTLTKFELMSEMAQADYAHRHDCYEVLYITEGEGTHIIDFEAYPVKAPMFFFLSKEHVHFWELTKPLKGYAMLFSEGFLGFPSSNVIRGHDFSVFDHVDAAPGLALSKEQQTLIHTLVEGMELEFKKECERSLSVLRAYLHILLTQLRRFYQAGRPQEYSETNSSMVRQFKQLVSEHFISDHSVQDYANRIGVTPSHLKDTVKAVTGSAPGQFIRQQLILEAKRFLVHSNVTVAEISYHLNFEDSSYFGRFFKRETGVSPLTFRQQVREKYRISPE